MHSVIKQVQPYVKIWNFWIIDFAEKTEIHNKHFVHKYINNINQETKSKSSGSSEIETINTTLTLKSKWWLLYLFIWDVWIILL